ncbi:hypothetical protein BDP81DRAFT_124318 [Colletotrichum phormii]|uniref:Uncharacterized protein n=1 Tax=Colletotrichum phormii TaxID=359342 RepID=A0AAJ0EJC8_9PEZI|nr:uncharacterized protein BDP81DRAFT_124318 [Colletotrichum phormii]KAK1640899.1 hypothetical protein BDP81DRAFT_124318 [Colletotrichum phormii]
MTRKTGNMAECFSYGGAIPLPPALPGQCGNGGKSAVGNMSSSSLINLHTTRSSLSKLHHDGWPVRVTHCHPIFDNGCDENLYQKSLSMPTTRPKKLINCKHSWQRWQGRAMSRDTMCRYTLVGRLSHGYRLVFQPTSSYTLTSSASSIVETHHSQYGVRIRILAVQVVSPHSSVVMLMHFLGYGRHPPRPNTVHKTVVGDSSHAGWCRTTEIGKVDNCIHQITID